MNTTPSFAAPVAVDQNIRPVDRNRIAQTDGRPQRTKPLMRKYEVAFLNADKQVCFNDHIAPATRIFEEAFSAFARGTMILTNEGPRAVEDLDPGMTIVTKDGGMAPLLWVGSMSLVPTAPVEAPDMLRLTRIMADTFGIARPAPDLMAGPGARLLRTPPEMRELALQTQVLTPARAFADGMSVIEITPPTSVAVYHLCLPHHAVIYAAGLEVETYHPGKEVTSTMGLSMQALFLSLFPHIKTLDDFGPLAYPRITQNTLNARNAA